MADDSRIYAALSYVCFVLSGIVVYMIRDKDPYARFHAMQSMLFTVALFVLSFVLGALQLVVHYIPVIGGVFGLLLSLVSLFISLVVVAAWLVLMYKAYSGERYKLPMIGDMAASMAGK
jgi:uncharacterized membrane protein